MSHTWKPHDGQHDEKCTENVEPFQSTGRAICLVTDHLFELLAYEEKISDAESNLREDDIHIHKTSTSRPISDHS